MNKGLFVRILICVCGSVLFLYNFINQQNTITELRLQIPLLSNRLDAIHEENKHFLFMLDKFNSPEHLMMLAELPEFQHLYFVSTDEIVDYSS